MKDLDEIVSRILAQQHATRALKKALCREKIVSLLKVLEYHEIIELLDEVAYEQVAKGEIAFHQTEQY